MYNHFRPKPGRFGTQPIVIASGQIGGANYLGGASPLTANTTTIFRLGPVPAKSVLYAFCASAVTVPADADGTILATLYKYSATADAQVALTSTIDLEALVTREGTRILALAGASEAALTCQVGDTLEVSVVNNSAAIDTQPVGLVFTTELLELE